MLKLAKVLGSFITTLIISWDHKLLQCKCSQIECLTFQTGYQHGNNSASCSDYGYPDYIMTDCEPYSPWKQLYGSEIIGDTCYVYSNSDLGAAIRCCNFDEFNLISSSNYDMSCTIRTSPNFTSNLASVSCETDEILFGCWGLTDGKQLGNCVGANCYDIQATDYTGTNTISDNTCYSYTGGSPTYGYAYGNCCKFNNINENINNFFSCETIWANRSLSGDDQTSTSYCQDTNTNSFTVQCGALDNDVNYDGIIGGSRNCTAKNGGGSTYGVISQSLCCSYNTLNPTNNPTNVPSFSPTNTPTNIPTNNPTDNPSDAPSYSPTNTPSDIPTRVPSRVPTDEPSYSPSNFPSNFPSKVPTNVPTNLPSNNPTQNPTIFPSNAPSNNPTNVPTNLPTSIPTDQPTIRPTYTPSNDPTYRPTKVPSNYPTMTPETIIDPNKGSSIVSDNSIFGAGSSLDIIIIALAIMVFCLCCIVLLGLFLFRKSHKKQEESRVKLQQIVSESNVVQLSNLGTSNTGQQLSTSTIPQNNIDMEGGNNNNNKNGIRIDIDNDDVYGPGLQLPVQPQVNLGGITPRDDGNENGNGLNDMHFASKVALQQTNINGEGDDDGGDGNDHFGGENVGNAIGGGNGNGGGMGTDAIRMQKWHGWEQWSKDKVSSWLEYELLNNYGLNDKSDQIKIQNFMKHFRKHDISGKVLQLLKNKANNKMQWETVQNRFPEDLQSIGLWLGVEDAVSSLP